MALARQRVAVVLFNLGGPDRLSSVQPFLFNLFRDPAILQAPAAVRYPLAALISTLRGPSARANYAHMGGASPLLAQTRAQAKALETVLVERRPDADVRVFVAMRYWRPFTEETAAEVEAFEPHEIVLLPLYPQYSTTTTASSLAAWSDAYLGEARQRAVCCYPAEAGLVSAHAARIQSAWEAAGKPANVRLLFSAHGLPERCIEAGDPYQQQVEQTCRSVLAALDTEWDWRICYQSRVGPMKWLGPTTPEAISEACCDGMGVLIAPIAFVSEHVETLVELDRDYARLAQAAGCKVYLRAAAVGTEPGFIAGLADMVESALIRRGIEPEGVACDPGCVACPWRAMERSLAQAEEAA